MKTQKELNALKEEYTTLNKKLAELSEQELAQVTGGVSSDRNGGALFGGSIPVVKSSIFEPNRSSQGGAILP